MVRLAVLGLLNRRPMHGYEIQRYWELTRSDQWAGILPGSFYHALKKLNSEGLIEIQSVEQTGNRTRAIYAITEKGREAFRQELREAWKNANPVFPSGIFMAINFVDELPRTEVVAAIDEQIAALEKHLAQWNEGERIKGEMSPFPELTGKIFANGRTHLETDLNMLRFLKEYLPNMPVFNWSVPKLSEEE